MLVVLSLKHRRGTFIDLDGIVNTVMIWYVYSMKKGPVKKTKDRISHMTYRKGIR